MAPAVGTWVCFINHMLCPHFYSNIDQWLQYSLTAMEFTMSLFIFSNKCKPDCKQRCEPHGDCIAPNVCRCHFGWVGHNCTTECQCNKHSNCESVAKKDNCTQCMNNTKVRITGLFVNLLIDILVKSRFFGSRSCTYTFTSMKWNNKPFLSFITLLFN